MSAYLVVHVHLRDTQWVEEYVANVPAIVRSFGGEYLAVSKALKQFEGAEAAPAQVAIFTFPSLEAIERFMNSEAYKPWKDLRLSQSSATIIGIEA